MEKNKGILYVFLPVLMTFGLYVVFYSRIDSKPSNAGFWLIFAMGMSIGAALTRFIQWIKNKK
jgi:hypothetical protein